MVTLAKEPTTSIPLKMNKDRMILIANTRVTLDIVVDMFLSGATPEEIVYQFPSLALADVYAVVGYYLYHRDEVNEYLQRRQVQSKKVRLQNEQRFPPYGIRERLLARQPQKVLF